METRKRDTPAGGTSIVEACPGTLPRHTGTLPGHTGAIPIHTGVSPKHMGTLPGHMGTFPKHAGAIPGYMGVAPKHTGTAPGHMGIVPKHAGAPPGHTGTLPGHPSGRSYRVETVNNRAHTTRITAAGIPVSRAEYPGGGAGYKHKTQHRREETSFRTAAKSKKE